MRMNKEKFEDVLLDVLMYALVIGGISYVTLVIVAIVCSGMGYI